MILAKKKFFPKWTLHFYTEEKSNEKVLHVAVTRKFTQQFKVLKFKKLKLQKSSLNKEEKSNPNIVSGRTYFETFGEEIDGAENLAKS